MTTLVVYAHPERNACHNALVLDEVLAWLKSKGIRHSLIDLYRDGFDPSLPSAEYKNRKHARLVKKYQKMISGSEKLVFIHPVWWYSQPAILKGFFDRVFTAGFAFSFRKMPGWMKLSAELFKHFMSLGFLYPVFARMLPVKKRLAGRKALVINSFGGNEAGDILFGRTPENSCDRAVLNFCGVSPVLRVNWYNARKPGMPKEIRKRIREKLERLHQ
ncbi:hypothetical protein GF318_02615 [Candidatus Micrarchaeota archaeon]|nr:hypothetical protein [Candidatus Micrarchaeota archaeon]